MVSLTINKKRFLQEIGREESEELLQSIVMMGAEIDAVTETDIVVDITPNRPDLLSQPGLTRAIKAFLGIEPGIREYRTQRSKLRVKVDESAQGVRPYTACAVATNLSLDDEKLRELIDIQEKLHITFCRRRKRAAIGIYPMEAISGTITFKALPPEEIRFRPLESPKEMDAKEILEQHPKGKEYAHLLEGLGAYPVFVDSKQNVLSMPPIINSHMTGKVTERTKEVFIESSGHDFKTCHDVVKMICSALADMGATIQTVDVVYAKRIERTPDMEPARQKFYRYYINKRLGTSLGKDDLPPLLAKMGLGFEDGRIRETHYAITPPYRVDFLHQIDVVEDIAIAYGYENMHAELPRLDTVASESPMTLFEDKVRSILSGLSLLEAKSYHLIGRRLQEELGLAGIVTLKSSVSEGYDSLRADLLASLLLTASRNQMHEYPQEFFEIGTVFRQDEGIREEEHLGIVLAGERDYTSIRQAVDALLRSLGLEGIYEPCEDPRFLKGRCASLSVNGIALGVLGEVAPLALESAGVRVPICASELSLDALLGLLR